ncbi:hypothetical protein VTJ04DRAFT_8542 [Mycothermus thermophilus]|uniref:uncharacterized protein n=1 Tax=Humicola insolens TaxID=85995 RepID=UPI003744637F
MLRSELRKAQEVMDQLGTLIEKILSQNVTRERVEWLLKKDRAGELKRQLAEANTRIQALLSASNYSMVKGVRHETLDVRASP